MFLFTKLKDFFLGHKREADHLRDQLEELKIVSQTTIKQKQEKLAQLQTDLKTVRLNNNTLETEVSKLRIKNKNLIEKNKFLEQQVLQTTSELNQINDLFTELEKAPKESKRRLIFLDNLLELKKDGNN